MTPEQMTGTFYLLEGVCQFSLAAAFFHPLERKHGRPVDIGLFFILYLVGNYLLYSLIPLCRLE